MKRKNVISIFLLVTIILIAGCGEKLSEKKKEFEGQGISYEMQLPTNWEVDKEDKSNEYGLQTVFSAEDKKSNSNMFVAITPVKDVPHQGFSKKTREQFKKRYGYKNIKDVYMKEFKVNGKPASKYTLYTMFNEKKVWAHLYYIWTDNGFVQVTFYSADDNKYEKRSEVIDASIETLVEVGFDTKKAKKAQEKQVEEEGDIVTLENAQMKIQMTATRKVTGKDKKDLLAIRYTFTNLQPEPAAPSVVDALITAKQKDKQLDLGSLPEDTTFLDVKDLENTHNEMVSQGKSVESVLFFELNDKTPVELMYSQDAFPGTKSTMAVVPE
ncbi:DUF5067 domain-containing protein [Enterococcus ureasiticus]|uniref:DUF5067 domain-containing protein n=1 Tax=Enterococcus ureasiticus TaxID=903984 RepID=A0A1E5GAT2_9ENTE|nr:DUF5067 domain-containing protein [Enterococcus ureasiticus]OEG09715.1 DUF5067 domain-containing protein [Enterococcus ureasiticus]